MAVDDLIRFGRYLGSLKELERTGWVRMRIPRPESVADHSFRTAVLAMILAPQYGADQLKAIKMALIHDIGEAIIGDIVTEQGAKVSKGLLKSKVAREKKAVRKIMSLVGTEDFYALFEEFEKNRTPEARLVKQIDKLEMALQAYEYEKMHGKDLEEFFKTARHRVRDKPMLKVLAELDIMRASERKLVHRSRGRRGS